MGSREGAKERGVGREEAASSSRQPSLMAVEQAASHLGLLSVEEIFPQLHHSGFCRYPLPFSFYSIN